MRLVIIEDEKRAMDRLSDLVRKLRPDYTIEASLSSIQQCRDWFSEPSDQYDFIISDIQLGDGRIFEFLKDLNSEPPIIFTTAYDSFALKAFQNNGVDYLLKPIDEEELEKALRKIDQRTHLHNNLDLTVIEDLLKGREKSYKNRFMIKMTGKLKSISTDEVSLFRSIEGGNYLVTDQGYSYAVDYTLDQLEEIVDPASFFRVNRSYILKFDSMENIHLWSGSRLKVELIPSLQKDQEEILVSRERVKDFKMWLDR